MKKIILNLPACADIPFETIKNNFIVCKIDESNKKQVETFVMNYVIGEKLPLERAFAVLLPINGNVQIIGILCFLDTDIRNNFENVRNINQENNINFNELSHFIVDKKLMNESLLSNILTRILPIIATDEIVDEVFWFEYNGFYSRRVKKIYKQYHLTYYFRNEADYFANGLITIHRNEIEHEKELFKKAENSAKNYNAPR